MIENSKNQPKNTNNLESKGLIFSIKFKAYQAFQKVKNTNWSRIILTAVSISLFALIIIQMIPESGNQSISTNLKQDLKSRP